MTFDNYPKPYELIKAGGGSEEELLQSLLPAFDDTRKVDYLVLRSVNFLSHQALAALDLGKETYDYWIASDQDFKDFEFKKLRYIQGHVAREYLRSSFMRNVFLQLAIDKEVLAKRAFMKESMDGEDRADAREASKRYSAQNIAALARVLEGDKKDQGQEAASYDFYVPLGTEEVEAVALKRASSKALLQQFSKNTSVNSLDGEDPDVKSD